MVDSRCIRDESIGVSDAHFESGLENGMNSLIEFSNEKINVFGGLVFGHDRDIDIRKWGELLPSIPSGGNDGDNRNVFKLDSNFLVDRLDRSVCQFCVPLTPGETGRLFPQLLDQLVSILREFVSKGWQAVFHGVSELEMLPRRGPKQPGWVDKEKLPVADSGDRATGSKEASYEACAG